jgi:hypothetical protein
VRRRRPGALLYTRPIVRPGLAITTTFCLLLTSMLDAQQVVFSHRVYLPRGRSYQQVWIWSADAGRLTQVSRSARDHNNPICEADSRHILFDVSGALRVVGTAVVEEPITQWRIDRATGDEQPLDPSAPGAGRAREATPSAAPSACDEGTARLSRDRARVSCIVKGTDVLIADARTNTETTRVPFEPRYSTGDPYAPWPMELIWSPDGRSLLVGNYGEGSSSTSSYLDYFLLDPTARTWTRAFSGDDALWVTPSLIVYVTPRDLSPLNDDGAHAVWTAHLTAFDPMARTTRPITSGLSNDLSPSACPR